jgi:hypothetical protein
LNETKISIIMSLLYLGAGWDFFPVKFMPYNKFIFVDALPNLKHYAKGEPVKLRNESVGTSFGVSQLHGAIEPIYTLHEFTQ